MTMMKRRILYIHKRILYINKSILIYMPILSLLLLPSERLLTHESCPLDKVCGDECGDLDGVVKAIYYLPRLLYRLVSCQCLGDWFY